MSSTPSAAPPPPPPPPPPAGPPSDGAPGPVPAAHPDARPAGQVPGDRPPPPPPRGWHYRRSLASRVTLLTTIAVGLAVATLATGVYVTARIQLRDQLDQSLLERARTVATRTTLSEDQVTDRVDLPAWALGAADVRIYLVRQEVSDTAVLVLLSGDRLPVMGPGELAVARGEKKSNLRTVQTADGTRYRVVAVPTGEPGLAVVMAQSQATQERILARLGVVSLLFGIVGVLAAGIAGWGVARNGLRPVRRLTTSVEQIAETQQLKPMPVEGDDEIARLTTAFNQMLVALDASRTRQRQLVTDAGHELRTPLTSLRTNVDLLVQAHHAHRDIDPEARTELLDDIGGQIDELTTLIGDLTELARDEPLAPVVGTVELADVVEAAVARVRRRAVGTTFDVELEPWEVVGEADALERAVTNLLDNAAKWSPPGGTVHVRLADGVLVVDDEGPGIAPEDRGKVFDRFWRAEESRTMPGSGLGLSIVSQVVGRHGGRVAAEESPSGGARLVAHVPGSRR